MLDGARLEEPPRGLDVREDGLVSLLHVLSLEVRHDLGEAPIIIDGARHRLPLLDHARVKAHPVIVLSEGGRLVHNARAAVVGDVPINEHAVGHLALQLGEVVEEGGVLGALKVLALDRRDELVVGLLLEHLRDARLRADVAHTRLGILDRHVLEIGVHTQRQVGGEGPGGGGPRHEVDGRIGADDREGDDALRVRHVLVVLASLEV
mmetsp:Transcript_64713/g.159263  ORF Transcript_64713/g.159263 Transcript_64713/m.159263 type:complete len:207 (+) Transcript_64713:2646-3266(+)